MPAEFERVELLPDSPPYDGEVMRRLGLRGLHCGCGLSVREGCLNSDRLTIRGLQGGATESGRIAHLDGKSYYLEHEAAQPFPIRDESFDWIAAEAFIEHLAPDDGVAWLAEMRRLLRPGGHVRLSTPDLRRYIEGYLDPDQRFFTEHRRRLAILRPFRERGAPTRRAWMVNQIFQHWGHEWIYDFDELRHTLVEAGFDSDAIVETRFREGKDLEAAALDLPLRNDESLYVEATRS
jgi:predicted SAM-dependent methyltransferase